MRKKTKKDDGSRGPPSAFLGNPFKETSKELLPRAANGSLSFTMKRLSLIGKNGPVYRTPTVSATNCNKFGYK